MSPRPRSSSRTSTSAAQSAASSIPSYLVNWLVSSPSASPNKTTLFGLIQEQNVVRCAMAAESFALLPVALAHLLAPAASLSPMLRKGVQADGLSSVITQWYGVSCVAIAVYGLLLGLAGQGTVPYTLRKFFYCFQLIGESAVIPLFVLFVAQYGEINFFSINYVFGTIMFSTLRVVSLTWKPQWFGLKDDAERVKN